MTSESQYQGPSKFVFWGGTGQAKVMRPILRFNNVELTAVFDDTPDLEPPFPDVPLVEGIEGFYDWADGRKLGDYGFCVTIGNPHGRTRLDIQSFLRGEGLVPTTLIHPTAHIPEEAEVAPGSQIHPGAIVMPEAKLGAACIVNTNASVDHECVLGPGVEVAPGGTLCGLVEAKKNSWVGAGATVNPDVLIGTDSVVGAGATVVEDVPGKTVVTGTPARPMSRESEDRIDRGWDQGPL